MAGQHGTYLKLNTWLKNTISWAKNNKWFVGALVFLMAVLGVLFPLSLSATIPLFFLIVQIIRNDANLHTKVKQHQFKLAVIILLFTMAIFLPLIPTIALFFKGIPLAMGPSASGFLSQLSIAFESITAITTSLLLSPLALIFLGVGAKWKLSKPEQFWQQPLREPLNDSCEGSIQGKISAAGMVINPKAYYEGIDSPLSTPRSPAAMFYGFQAPTNLQNSQDISYSPPATPNFIA